MTAKENASHRTTFTFFDSMFPSLDNVPQIGGPKDSPPAEPAQSTSLPSGNDATGVKDTLPFDVDETQIDFGSE